MKASARTKGMSKIEKLTEIENTWHEIGNACTNAFDKSADIVTIRAGVAAHRCAMQAMRDSMRYAIKN